MSRICAKLGATDGKVERPDMNFALASALLATLWAGLVLGISFVAQPAKFATPGLPRPLAFATGRQMFRAMHLTEIALASGAIVLLMLAGETRRWPVFGAALVLALQMTLLMPPLSRRVDARLAGHEPGPSPHHAVFAVLELTKTILLLAFSLTLLFNFNHG